MRRKGIEDFDEIVCEFWQIGNSEKEWRNRDKS